MGTDHDRFMKAEKEGSLAPSFLFLMHHVKVHAVVGRRSALSKLVQHGRNVSTVIGAVVHNVQEHIGIAHRYRRKQSGMAHVVLPDKIG